MSLDGIISTIDLRQLDFDQSFARHESIKQRFQHADVAGQGELDGLAYERLTLAFQQLCCDERGAIF